MCVEIYVKRCVERCVERCREGETCMHKAFGDDRGLPSSGIRNLLCYAMHAPRNTESYAYIRTDPYRRTTDVQTQLHRHPPRHLHEHPTPYACLPMAFSRLRASRCIRNKTKTSTHSGIYMHTYPFVFGPIETSTQTRKHLQKPLF